MGRSYCASFFTRMPQPELLERLGYACESLGWEDIDVDAEEGLVAASVPWSWRSVGERLWVSVSPTEAGSRMEVCSRVRGPQLIDFGKNRRNVSSLLHASALDGLETVAFDDF